MNCTTKEVIESLRSCVYGDCNKCAFNKFSNCSDELKTIAADMLEKHIEAKKTIKIMLDNGAYQPTRAHSADAGLDLYAREMQIVPAKESATFDTGVHVEIPNGYVGMLKSKSGLNVKHGITNEGVIDAGYTGSIVVKLYNNSGVDYVVNAGDKISQLVIMPIITPEVEIVDCFAETDRGNNGFGSSGK